MSQALFTGHPDKHPIVILKDVPYVDMRSLLDFMYRGEVSVDQDRLTAFLRVAESLRIKGLTEVNEDKCDLPSITSSLLGNQNASQPPPPSLHRINQLGQHHHMPQKRYTFFCFSSIFFFVSYTVYSVSVRTNDLFIIVAGIITCRVIHCWARR